MDDPKKTQRSLLDFDDISLDQLVGDESGDDEESGTDEEKPDELLSISAYLLIEFVKERSLSAKDLFLCYKNLY